MIRLVLNKIMIKLNEAAHAVDQSGSEVKSFVTGLSQMMEQFKLD